MLVFSKMSKFQIDEWKIAGHFRRPIDSRSRRQKINEIYTSDKMFLILEKYQLKKSFMYLLNRRTKIGFK